MTHRTAHSLFITALVLAFVGFVLAVVGAVIVPAVQGVSAELHRQVQGQPVAR